MLSALSSHWLFLSPGLGITIAVEIITIQEAALSITPLTLISITTTVMQVVLGTGTTVSGMGITITTAGIGTALGRWLVLP